MRRPRGRATNDAAAREKRSRARPLCLVFVLAAVAISSRTSAYVCIGPDQSALPLPTSPAPLNTHVWLFLPKHYKSIRCATPPCDGRFVLRTAPGNKPAQGAPLTVVGEATSGDLTAIELAPSGLLTPRTSFETWWVPASSGEPRLISVFRTGDAVDRTRPTSPALTRAVREVARSLALGDPGQRQIAIEGTPATDDGLPTPLYEVWLDDGAKVAERPPDVIVNRQIIDASALYRPNVLVLGTGSGCASTLHDLPPAGTRIRLRAIDLAGNRGSAIDTVLAN